MPFESLAAFVRALRDAGELAVVDAPVDPRLEIAEITDRVVKAGGPALLFRHVRGSRFPVLTNQFGTERRTALAFGATSLREVEQRVRRTVDPALPDSLGGKLGRLAALAHAAHSALPRRVERAPVQAVTIDPPDLGALPVLTTWPLDGGPFITLGLVVTKDPETGSQNVGIYRIQVYDGTTLQDPRGQTATLTTSGLVTIPAGNDAWINVYTPSGTLLKQSTVVNGANTITLSSLAFAGNYTVIVYGYYGLPMSTSLSLQLQ